MPIQTRPSASIALCADEGSTLAERLIGALAERGFRLRRIGLRLPIQAGVDAAVLLVEHRISIDVLRHAVDRAKVPTLVVAATPELASLSLPLLEARDDLALATEAVEVIAWRLRRAIDQPFRPTPRLSEVEPLTGVLNRHTWTERFRETVESMAPEEVSGVLLLDLDNFKSINDRFGHHVGDKLLAAVGGLLPNDLAPCDLVGRVGGEEFGCLLIRYDMESIVRDSERLLESIRALDLPELRVDGAKWQVTASAGLTFFRVGVDPHALLHEADQAMYEAKRAGRNRLVVHDQFLRAAQAASRDLQVRHFENVTRVATDRLVAMITQMSRRLVDAARQEANLDALTNLHNRRYFDARLAREIESAREHGRALSLALIDIDRFHDVNMTHGWPTGDRVLQTFATVAQGRVRATDWVARYGGEEFVVVMPDAALAAAVEVVGRVRRAFAETVIESLEGRRLAATFSAGVAQLSETEGSSLDLLQLASKRLLTAKGAGRNRTEPDV